MMRFCFRSGCRVLFIVLYLVAGAGNARTLCEVKGRVEGPSGPLSGVSVSIGRHSGLEQVATSERDGSFHFSIETLPSSRPRLGLVVNKEGFGNVERLLKRNPIDGCPLLQPDHISMEPEEPARNASSSGNTLFVAPHTIYPEDHPSIGIARKISKRFGDILYHYIKSYVSSLETNTIYDFGFRYLDDPLSFSDLERIRREGRERNALAIIAGEGEVVQSDNQQQRIDLVSGFHIIPVLPGYQERRIQLQDSLQLRDASAFSISRDLRDLWGQKTIVALVVRNLAAMRRPYDQQSLKEVRRTLLEVRRTISKQDPIYHEVQALLEMLEKELQS